MGVIVTKYSGWGIGDTPENENAFKGEIARVMYWTPRTDKWLVHCSRNVSNGLYDSVLSAHRAVRQFRGYGGATYKVQQLVTDSEGYMFWHDVKEA